MRWKAFFFTDPVDRENEENNNAYRAPFKSKRCPPTIPDMKDFEKDLSTMIENIKFKNASSDFQSKLKEDIKRINESEKLIVPADKTQNFYKVSKEDYNKILQENVTKEYKKAPAASPSLINKEAKKLAKNYDILDRANTMSTPQAFVTIKDHKEDFRTNPKYRLLNPCKSELGKISKGILQKVNSTLRNILGLNQWRDPNQVIEWFKNIDGKSSCTFTTFDVKEFYPSITEPLLRKAINFAKRYTDINPGDIKVIFHCRKSLLYHNNVPWIKKKNEARAKLISALNPILQNYMTENKIEMIVDKKHVLLANSNLEITDKILEILNKEVKSINLN